MRDSPADQDRTSVQSGSLSPASRLSASRRGQHGTGAIGVDAVFNAPVRVTGEVVECDFPREVDVRLEWMD